MKNNEITSVLYRDLNKVHLYIDFSEYKAIFRNEYGYTIYVSNIYAFDFEEAEEQARLALAASGYKEEEFETITIEGI